MSGAPISRAPRIEGARIAVVLESKYIPEEIVAYQERFAALGAEVDLVSRLYYGDHRPEMATFLSDVDPNSACPIDTPRQIHVSIDISTVDLSCYDALLMAANYTSIRLRYPGEIDWNDPDWSPHDHIRQAPVVQLFNRSMDDNRLIKGLLCHGTWILTPNPERLKGRKLICHSVVMADILNCGAEIVRTPDRVVVDDDLVTGFSKDEVHTFIDAIATQVAARRSKEQGNG